MSLATLKTKVEQLIEKAQNGGGTEFTAGFTSEKYKKWLEINGYTISKFTLTTTALADFDISHTLGRKAQSIICFRTDIDCTETDRKVYFAFDLYGEAKDTLTNRLDTYVVNPLRQVAWGMPTNNEPVVDYYAVKENTNTYIKFRFVNNFDKDCTWASGDYYLAVL